MQNCKIVFNNNLLSLKDRREIFEKEIRVEVKKGSHAVGSLKPGDIFMHKQNIYHLAAEYSHECLEILLRVRQENPDYSKGSHQKN